MKRNYPLWNDVKETQRQEIYEIYVKDFFEEEDIFDDEPATFEEFNKRHQFDTFRCVKHHYTGEWK